MLIQHLRCMNATSNVCMNTISNVGMKETSNACMNATSSECMSKTSKVCTNPTSNLCMNPTSVAQGSQCLFKMTPNINNIRRLFHVYHVCVVASRWLVVSGHQRWRVSVSWQCMRRSRKIVHVLVDCNRDIRSEALPHNVWPYSRVLWRTCKRVCLQWPFQIGNSSIMRQGIIIYA